MLRIISLSVFLVISGCTTGGGVGASGVQTRFQFNKPKIHLHVYGELSEQSDRYYDALINAGYEVRIRDNDLPMSDKTSFIVYNLSNPQYFELEKIKMILGKEGITIHALYPYRNGKHMYSLGNVGIYLM